jgi:hypothetical protein
MGENLPGWVLSDIEKSMNNPIEIFKTDDEQVSLTVSLEGESVWLSQAQMVELFGRDRSVITKHINNIFKDGELERKSNVQNLHIANSDKPVAFFSLDVIISVGYRVKSQSGVQFRKWATKVPEQLNVRMVDV